MRCPFCGEADTQVKDSRPTEDGSAIRRRRFCGVPFDRDKLARSVRIALRKRPVEDERIERIVNGIVRKLEASGETDVKSHEIGELVMDTLKEVDPVAYVRFASVYRDFRETKDFENFLGEMEELPKAPAVE
jgi:transcriptional repressor NrdR